MTKKKQGWIMRNLEGLRETIAPIHPEDSRSTKIRKKLGFAMFLTLLGCSMLGVMVAVSFAH